MLVHVGPSWPQDASMLAQVGLKIPKMAYQGLQQTKFPLFLIQSYSFWNIHNLQNIQESVCVTGSFAIGNCFLLVMLVGSPSWLKFTPSCLTLPYLS